MSAKAQDPGLPDVSSGDFQIGDLLVAADQVGEDVPEAEPPPRRHGDMAMKLDRSGSVLTINPSGTAETVTITKTYSSHLPGAHH